MSTHINAKDGAIAKAVLLPGDPLRAKFIAENFLDNAVCYNEVRGMYGFTGTYKGRPVSVQGTGMGQPSISIYVNELFQVYGVEKAIRIGTCGSLQTAVKLKDMIIAISACSDSAILTQRFGSALHFAPTADYSLLAKAAAVAEREKFPHVVAPVISSDLFYRDDKAQELLASYGVAGVEMEAAELYTLAAKFGRKALAIMTVSDHVLTGETTTAEERQLTFTNMMRVALETVTA
jgi:purine-nucleoside phosphorylase